MSEVKRYDDESGCWHCAGNSEAMVKDSKGDWVEFVDYEELKEDLGQDLEEARQYAKEWMDRAREAEEAFARILELQDRGPGDAYQLQAADAVRCVNKLEKQLEQARQEASKWRAPHVDRELGPDDNQKFPWENDDE